MCYFQLYFSWYLEFNYVLVSFKNKVNSLSFLFNINSIDQQNELHRSLYQYSISQENIVKRDSQIGKFSNLNYPQQSRSICQHNKKEKDKIDRCKLKAFLKAIFWHSEQNNFIIRNVPKSLIMKEIFKDNWSIGSCNYAFNFEILLITSIDDGNMSDLFILLQLPQLKGEEVQEEEEDSPFPNENCLMEYSKFGKYLIEKREECKKNGIKYFHFISSDYISSDSIGREELEVVVKIISSKWIKCLVNPFNKIMNKQDIVMDDNCICQ